MALIYPFRGFRYNRKIVTDLSSVVTQPYDKTTPDMQQAYYLRSPYNAVRLTMNMEKRQNAVTEYSDAAATFKQWIDHKVLIREPFPTIYAYYQEYVIEGQTYVRKGFIALLDLKDSKAVILPHEHTLDEPKQDRLRLMRSLEANDDLIHMLYTDRRFSVNAVLERSIAGKLPESEVKDEYDTIHRLWTITEPEALRAIQDAMLSQDLFIADGHHRFETSINFMKECEQKNWKPAAVESFDKRMATFFNSADGVTILATHRLIRDLPGFDALSFLDRVRQDFQVEPVRSAADLWTEMKPAQNQKTFGFYPASLKQFFVLRLKEPALADPFLSRYSEAYRRLDVSILHSLILDRYLGIDENKLTLQAYVDYERDPETCIRLVDQGKYQAVFFLNPSTVEQMLQIASMGERMPQKSTDFFPKLLTGLVFMKMEIEK